MARINPHDLAGYGPEPTWTGKANTSMLSKALTWYTYHHNVVNPDMGKTAKEYTIHYLKDLGLHHPLVDKIPNWNFMSGSVGWIAKLTMRGLTVADDVKERFETNILELLTKANTYIETTSTVTAPVDTPVKKETMVTSYASFNTEIEFLYDKKRLSKPPSDIVSGIGYREVFKKKLLREIESLSSSDVRDYFPGYTKKDLASITDAISSLLKAMEDNIAITVTTTRKPRTPKPITPEKRVKGLRFLPSTDKYTSINPTDIIGAQELWVFNTKTRTISLYKAKPNETLSVDGASIINYDTELSMSKNVRDKKVSETLESIKSGGKVHTKRTINDLVAKPQSVNPRTTADTLLLRTFK